jgi:WXG100 family type VII secretion target
MSDAIGTVSGDRDAIQGDISQIASQFQLVEGSWTSPAGETFVQFNSTLTAATQNLMELLDDMVSRMRTTYRNYREAEESNAANLT